MVTQIHQHPQGCPYTWDGHLDLPVTRCRVELSRSQLSKMTFVGIFHGYTLWGCHGWIRKVMWQAQCHNLPVVASGHGLWVYHMWKHLVMARKCATTNYVYSWTHMDANLANLAISSQSSQSSHLKILPKTFLSKAIWALFSFTIIYPISEPAAIRDTQVSTEGDYALAGSRTSRSVWLFRPFPWWTPATAAAAAQVWSSHGLWPLEIWFHHIVWATEAIKNWLKMSGNNMISIQISSK